MKEVRAYIQPHKLQAVSHALHQLAEVTGMSATMARGFGRRVSASESHRVEEELELLAPCVRVEVVCQDGAVEAVVHTIQRAAHSGLRGDGIIYVSRVEDAVRIATGERGERAV